MKKTIGIVLAVLLIIVLPVSVFADNVNRMTIEKGQVLHSDWFAAGNYVKNAGEINGDIYAGTDDFTNEGTVKGDIIVGAGRSEIGGRVDGDLRIGTGNGSITGEITRNVTAFAGELILEESAAVDGNFNAFAGNLRIDGIVGGDLKAGVETLHINNQIKGDVEVSVGSLDFGPLAKIDGDLIYTSEEEMTVPEGIVSGKIEHKIPTDKAAQDVAKRVEKGAKVFHVAAKAISMLGYLIIGTILVLVFGDFMKRTAATLEEKPWHSVGIGVVGLVTLPIASILVMITVIGIPLGLITFMLYGIMVYLAKLPAGIWIGQKILKNEEKPLLPLLLGIIILMLISYIPYLGALVSLVAILFGIGSFLYNLRESIAKEKPKDLLE
ncbi:MAG: hypothetical protein ACOYVK_13735 [Bacillota bacterium]